MCFQALAREDRKDRPIRRTDHNQDVAGSEEIPAGKRSQIPLRDYQQDAQGSQANSPHLSQPHFFFKENP